MNGGNLATVSLLVNGVGAGNKDGSTMAYDEWEAV